MKTMTAAPMPVLYAEPLPTDLLGRLREQLRRVRRSRYGGERSLTYSLAGECGSWQFIPEGYVANKHRGRAGRFLVQERKHYAEIGDEQLFETEQAGWDWVTAEHARRADARLSELATEHAGVVAGQCERLRADLAEAEAELSAWQVLALAKAVV